MNDATQFFNTTAGGGYEISRSLRFNSSDSAYLSRTPASAGNRKTWTWAGWVKLAAVSTQQSVFAAATDSINRAWLRFNNGPLQLRFEEGGVRIELITNAVYRDPSAWYHIVVAVDTTQATTSNRSKIYVNGEQVTSFNTEQYPSQNYDTYVNGANIHTIGSTSWSIPAVEADSYMADVHLIDGQALDPTSFGEYDTNGVWQPKAYAGTYGTNGFHLPFSNNSTAAALGTDTSGNGNTWTVNNLSVTAGAGNDSLVDTPTSYGTDTGAGGEVRGNYATLNPLPNTSGNSVLTNGNLDYAGTQAPTYALTGSSIAASSGKWYWEVTIGSTLGPNLGIGVFRISNPNYSTFTSGTDGGIAFFHGIANTIYYWNGSSQSTSYTLASCTTGDVVSVALDLDNGGIYFAKNGSWGASGNPATQTNPALTGLSGNYVAGISIGASGTSTATFNFGQRPFAYTAPSGFKALCTTNLPEPTIADGSTAMDVALYTGNGSTQTISGLNFSPDLVWIKKRSDIASSNLLDTVRGARVHLESNTTNSEYTESAGVGLTAFNSDGFSLGTDNAGSGQVNASGGTFVAWTWDAGSSTVTNTQGSITSQVRANPGAGFSVVTYTGNSTIGATVGHGLGVAPEMIIIKQRTGTFGWRVYHKSLGNTNVIFLNLTNATAVDSAAWNNTSPSSSVITFGNSQGVNGTGSGYVAYCFASVAGYSSFGSYTGNGSADGPFVYTGFRPRWVMIKVANISGESWVMKDSARGTFNPNNPNLYADLSIAEQTNSTARYIDFTSNGFKLRGTEVSVNGSGNTYVYMCFAEHPFAYARAR